MKLWNRKLVVRIGVIIVLTEFIIMGAISTVYYIRFSNQIDERLQDEILTAGRLIANGNLGVSTLADRDAMTILVGEQVIDTLMIRNNNIIFSLNPNYTSRSPEALPDFDVTLLESEDTELITKTVVDGRNVLTAVFTQSDIRIVIRTDIQKAVEDKQQLVLLLLSGTLATVIATSLALLVSFNTSVINQLSSLLKVLSHVEQGDLSVRVNRGARKDEIGKLHMQVNLMISRLQNLFETLEQKVSDRTRDLVEARDEAQRANNAKTAFLATTSHELRTPLNAVINYTRLIASGHWGPTTPEQSDALDTISKNGRHLLNLINDLLDMSKIASGSLEIFESDVDLNSEIEEVIKIGQGLLENDNVEIITEIDPNLPSLFGDGVRIRQIMINMVSNACKFTESGHVRLIASTHDESFLFKVEDTGIGIKAEDYDAVFAAFQQTESGILKGKGTGLGMSISKSLAEAHGGNLRFESRYGEGTTFYLELPLNGRSQLTPQVNTENGNNTLII